MLNRSIIFSFIFASFSVFGLDHATVGIYAVQMDTGKVVIDENSNMSLIPASCMKVVTTAAALHLLGSETQFETHLEYDGIIKEKILDGNLYIKGGGDPSLGSDRVAGSLGWKRQIQAWADAIQNLGISKIQGKVIGDASRWEKASAVPSWSWEDLGNYYGAGACALSFHENMYALFFKPGSKIGEKTAILRTEPPLTQLVLQNEVTTGPQGSGDRACIYGSELSSVHSVRGTIPLEAEEFAIKGAIPDPARFCADLLTQELQERGIEVRGKGVPVQPSKITFHTTVSPKVSEIVHLTNRRSINLYAEHLLKSMGEVVSHEGSTEAGLNAVTNFLASQKIDLGGFKMADGSGLSRKNLVTPKLLVSILLKMKKSEFFPIFLRSLPEQTSLVRAKTGSMSLVKGYTGYAGNIAFAILINQCCDHKAMEKTIDQFFLKLHEMNH